jgi:integrase
MVHPLPWSQTSHGYGADEVKAFLSYLTNERHVSVSTHKPALCALLFLYKQVLQVYFPWLDGVCRPNRPPRLPIVLTEWEVSAVIAEMKDHHALVVKLQYGTGMRLMEALMLQVKNVDFGRREIIIREGKKDKVTMLPLALVNPLKEQIALVRSFYDADGAAGRPGVMLPDALERKYSRAAGCSAAFADCASGMNDEQTFTRRSFRLPARSSADGMSNGFVRCS